MITKREFGGPPETRTPDPLIKSQSHSEPGQNINKKIQLFQGVLALFSAMAGVCSAQVQAQNEHSPGADNARRQRRMTEVKQTSNRKAPLIEYQTFHSNMLKVQLFFAAVLELCMSENSSTYESITER